MLMLLVRQPFISIELMAITFNEGDAFAPEQFTTAASDPTLVRLLKQWGIASTTQQANLILIGVAAGSFLLSVFIFWQSIKGPSGEEDVPPPMESMEGGAMPPANSPSIQSQSFP
jgi:hypothetical protein